MSVRDLIDAIESGDSLATQQCFETEMMQRISDQMDLMRKSVAQNMFKESVDEDLCLEDFALEELEEFMQTEEFNQLDELSKTTLGNYIKKAAQSRVKLGDREHKLQKTSDDISKASGASSDISPETRSQLYKARNDIDDQRYKIQNKSDIRQDGIIRAVKRLTK